MVECQELASRQLVEGFMLGSIASSIDQEAN